MINVKIFAMDFEKYEWLFKDIISFGIKVGLALLIFTIGFWLSQKLKRIIRNRLIKRNVDPSIREFIIPILDFLFKLLVILSAVSTLGVHTTSFAAIIAGLAAGIGLSLQGSLSNFAGGILIILFKPFKVGDYIETLGHSGTVKVISILYTTITTSNQQEVVLPNASVLNNPVMNYSVNPLRRLEIKIGIAYNEDLNKTIDLLREMLNNEEKIDKTQSITVEVSDFEEYRINLAVRAFTKREDYWDVYYKLHKKTIELLNEHKIIVTPSPSKMIIKDNIK